MPQGHYGDDKSNAGDSIGPYWTFIGSVLLAREQKRLSASTHLIYLYLNKTDNSI